MYYILQSKIVSWRNRELQAELRDFGYEVGRGKNRTYIPVPEPVPHWWDAKPLVEPLPDLVFKVSRHAPLLDNYFTGTIFDLYSNKLISILGESKVRFETFNAELVDKDTKEYMTSEYKVFHLLEMRPALNMQKSEFHGHHITRLQLDDSVLNASSPMFRVQERANIVLIHAYLRDKLVEAGITGCKYTPIEEFQTGIGLRRIRQ